MATRDRQRRSHWRCALMLFVCAAMAAPAAQEYRTLEFESLKITIDSAWGPRLAPGYLPVRFDISNLGDARTIEIVGEGSRLFRPPRASTGTTSIRQTVRLARGDRVRLTIPVPVFGDSENIRFEIREDNRTLERLNYNGFQSRASSRDASVLIVADPNSSLTAIASGLKRTLPGRGTAIVTVPGGVVVGARRGGTLATMVAPGPPGGPQLDYVIDSARLPANWLGFTSLRAVVIGAAEWAQLSDGQKGALLTWTACGGDLIFVDGDLGVLLPSVQGEAATDPDRVTGRHFFGRVHVLTSASLASAGLAKVLSATETTREAEWALPANSARDWGVIQWRGFRLRIPGIDGVPARVYLSILILFTLLIGPANYWFLWRKRRQVLFVLTAPLISAVFIVLLAGYAVAGEGLSVQGRAVTFTMLDQVTKQAATRASVSLYAAGMTPSGGLRFPRDVAVFAIGPEGTGSRDRLTLDLTDSQRFVTGVLQARAPANFEQIAFRPARERLTFSRGADGVSVTNGLEASLTALVYRDGDTMYRLDGPLPPGGKALLRAGAVELAQLLPADMLIPLKLEEVAEHQPRGSYLAVLDRSPFWEPGLPAIVERGSLHVVLGWPEGRP